MKKLLALFIALVMLLSLFPVSALAEEDKGDGQTQEETLKDPVDSKRENPAGKDDPADDTPDGLGDKPTTDVPGEEPGTPDSPGEEPGIPNEPGEEPGTPDKPADVPEEGNAPVAEEPAQEAQPVRVVFACDPEETVVTVYEAVADEDGELVPALDEDGEYIVIAPEEDGAYLLLPGNYLYDAECEGYTSVERAALTVELLDEGEGEQVVGLELNAVLKGVALRGASGWASWTTTGDQAQDIVNCAVAQKGKSGDELGASGAWCAWFIWTCARKVGISAEVIPQTNYANIGEKIVEAGGSRVSSSEARPGDIVCFTSYASNGNISYNHVGIIIDNSLTTISGNLSDQVYRATVSQVCSWNSWSVDMVKYYRPCYSSSTNTNSTFASFENASQSEIRAKIEQIKNQINGKYWNGGKTESDLRTHINSQDYAYGTTNSACSGDRTAHNTDGTGCTSNTFKGGTQCNGFARYMAYAVFGVDYNSTNDTWTVLRGDAANGVSLMSGDLLYFFPTSQVSGGTHWAMVWYIDGNNIYLADANHGSNCKIFFGQSFTVSAVLNEAVAGKISIVKPKCNMAAVTPVAAKTVTSSDGLHTYVRYDNVSYTWKQAEAYCESLDGGHGHLATITSSTEQSLVLNSVLSGCAKNVYFIGATDEAVDKTWKWVTGETFSFSNWDADKPEPTNKDDEDYAAIMGKQVGENKAPGEWIDIYNDGDANASYSGYELYNCGFICEYDYVAFDANGGTGAPSKQTKPIGTLTLTSAKPSRSGVSAGNYTITLNANGGSVSSSSLPAEKTTNYTFKNWNTKANGSGTSYASGASYTGGAATLYAQWTSSTSTAAVTLPTPTRTGYTFKGWGTSSTASSGYTGSYTPTGNVTLYAIWEANTYTIAYDANGGTGAPADQTKTHGTDLELSSTKPTRANASYSYTVTLDANGGSVTPASLNAQRTVSYTFKNWNTQANGGGTSYASGANYTANASATLYAQWNESSTTAVDLPTPTRIGYTFKGWGTSSTASSGYTGSYTPTGDVTLYAIWEATEAATLQVSTARARAGEDVTLSVSIDKNPGLAMLEFAVDYDTEKLALTGYASSVLPDFYGNTATGRFVWVNDSNVTATGELFTLSFKVAEGLDEGLIAVSLQNLAAADLDENGVDLLTASGGVNVVNRVPGDVTGDGLVNGMDLLRLKKYLVGMDVSIDMSNADVTGEGTVNGMDLLRLKKYLVGMSVTLS